MLVDFKSLPDTSRIWIYQADRTLSDDEVAHISERFSNFVRHWKRHREDLKASFQLEYNQFIILAVDELYTQVSGCSIDASIYLMRALEKELNVALLDKMNISFKSGNTINTVSLKEFKDYAKQEKITKQTIVFNNMIATKADLESAWQIEASQSWHAKFL